MKIETGQLALSDYSPDWPAPSERVIDGVTQLYYQNAINLVRQYNIVLPDSSDIQAGIGTSSLRIANPIYTPKRPPMLCEVTPPQELEWVFKALQTKTKYKDNLYLPDLFDLMILLYGGVSGNDRTYSNLSRLYSPWFNKFWDQWWSDEGKGIDFKGWEAVVKTEDGGFIDFHFSPLRKLEQMHVSKSARNIKLMQLTHSVGGSMQTADFRNGRLTNLSYSVPNGTFFPDPKGPKEEIFPWWVRDFDPKSTQERRPGTKAEWEAYLNKIQQKQRVISGLTGEFVMQDTQRAIGNLERWREVIYYSTDQLFLFRASPFRAEIGYHGHGRFGPFVVRNSNSYQRLTPEQAVQRLHEFIPQG